MKVLIDGHRYELENFEDKEAKGQELQFIQKEPKLNENLDLVTISDGTTNEEVIKVLLNRLAFMNEKFPCAENIHAQTHLRESLWWLNERTRERLARNVEGKHEA